MIKTFVCKYCKYQLEGNGSINFNEKLLDHLDNHEKIDRIRNGFTDTTKEENIK